VCATLKPPFQQAVYKPVYEKKIRMDSKEKINFIKSGRFFGKNKNILLTWKTYDSLELLVKGLFLGIQTIQKERLLIRFLKRAVLNTYLP